MIYIYIYVYSDQTVFNLSRKVLTETDIKILEKGLILYLFKERLMNPNLEVILKNSAEGYGLNGTLEMNLVQTLVTCPE